MLSRFVDLGSRSRSVSERKTPLIIVPISTLPTASLTPLAKGRDFLEVLVKEDIKLGMDIVKGVPSKLERSIPGQTEPQQRPSSKGPKL